MGSTWLSLVAPRCSTSMETTSSSALLSKECTVFACSPSRTLAIRTSSPLWSTEQLSLSDLSFKARGSNRDGSRWRARMQTHHITDIVRLFARLLLIHIKIYIYLSSLFCLFVSIFFNHGVLGFW